MRFFKDFLSSKWVGINRNSVQSVWMDGFGGNGTENVRSSSAIPLNPSIRAEKMVSDEVGVVTLLPRTLSWCVWICFVFWQQFSTTKKTLQHTPSEPWTILEHWTRPSCSGLRRTLTHSMSSSPSGRRRSARASRKSTSRRSRSSRTSKVKEAWIA